MRRALLVTALILAPTVARADALDAMWIVAAAVGGVWLMILLGALSVGFGSAKSGSRALTALGVVGMWIVLSPPVLIALTENWHREGGGLFWGLIAQWVLAPITVGGILTALMVRTLRRARRVGAHASPAPTPPPG